MYGTYIGEYYAKKIYFSPYFSLSEVESCPNLHFFGQKLSIHLWYDGRDDPNTIHGKKNGKI